MMSLSTMLAMRREAEVKSQRNHTKPAFWLHHAQRLNKKVPFIGDYRPEDFGLVDRESLAVPENVPAWKVHDSICDAPFVEVDLSGWGADYEPALTREEFLAVARVNPDVGWALVEVGQFQGVVGAFRLRG